jgi:hypothetical protein
MKLGLSNHQPVCVCVCVCACVFPTNNFSTDQRIFMKFGRKVMLLKVTSTPLFNLVTSAIPKWRTFKLLTWVQRRLNRLVDLDEILYGGDDIEGDVDYILFNDVASTIPKLRTFKLLG